MPAVNDHFTATVRDVNAEGNGVVEHPEGQVFFVPGVWVGETAEFRITGFRKRFGFARLVALLEPSPARIEPPCPHHGFGRNDCGGCPWQFVDYGAQLEAKQQRVAQAMARLGAGVAVQPIWGAPHIYGYRNRAQLKTDGQVLGYVAQGSNSLAEIDDCLILTDCNRDTLKVLKARLPDSRLRPPRREHWTTLDIDEDVDADTLVPNQRRPFRQGNSEQNARMRQWLGARLATLEKDRAVVELFAGSGNFTEVIAAAGFASVLAVEGVDEAVAALAARQLPGVQTLACNLFGEDACGQVLRQVEGASVLVLDPPRDGLKTPGRWLPKKHPWRDVLYISCDLATFARDLQVFVEDGFRVEDVQPLDQFPHTPHIELLAWLRKVR